MRPPSEREKWEYVDINSQPLCMTGGGRSDGSVVSLEDYLASKDCHSQEYLDAHSSDGGQSTFIKNLTSSDCGNLRRDPLAAALCFPCKAVTFGSSMCAPITRLVSPALILWLTHFVTDSWRAGFLAAAGFELYVLLDSNVTAKEELWRRQTEKADRERFEFKDWLREQMKDPKFREASRLHLEALDAGTKAVAEFHEVVDKLPPGKTMPIDFVPGYDPATPGVYSATPLGKEQSAFIATRIEAFPNPATGVPF